MLSYHLSHLCPWWPVIVLTVFIKDRFQVSMLLNLDVTAMNRQIGHFCFNFTTEKKSNLVLSYHLKSLFHWSLLMSTFLCVKRTET